MYVYFNQTLCLRNTALLGLRERVVERKATYMNKINIWGFLAFWIKNNQQTCVFSYLFSSIAKLFFFLFQMCFVRKIVCNRSFDACVNYFIVSVTVFCKMVILVPVTQTYMVLFMILNWTFSTIFYRF